MPVEFFHCGFDKKNSSVSAIFFELVFAPGGVIEL